MRWSVAYGCSAYQLPCEDSAGRSRVDRARNHAALICTPTPLQRQPPDTLASVAGSPADRDTKFEQQPGGEKHSTPVSFNSTEAPLTPIDS